MPILEIPCGRPCVWHHATHARTLARTGTAICVRGGQSVATSHRGGLSGADLTAMAPSRPPSGALSDFSKKHVVAKNENSQGGNSKGRWEPSATPVVVVNYPMVACSCVPFEYHLYLAANVLYIT